MLTCNCSAPNIDMALYVLNDAFSASKAIQSAFNIGHVRSLYSKLAKSPYGTSPDVTDLGLALRNWYKRVPNIFLPKILPKGGAKVTPGQAPAVASVDWWSCGQ
jgi:hypothetical protein